MESGFTLEKESHTIAIICRDLVVVLAFDTRELLIQWQVKIKAHLCEEQHFLVQITNLPPKSKLSCGPARLHLQDHIFCLVSGIPPRLLSFWPIKELRRFGVIDGKFCFEGGSHCGKGAGVHVLHTNQSEELAKCFELALNGRLHEKRRLSSNKNSSIDGSVRMSLQQTKCHKSCECGSNESSRPLISSGSESSVCDACSEIIRFNGSNGSNDDNELSGESDEHYSSRSTCSTILRCSSNLSCNIGQPYISSLTSDNDCFLTSHHSLGILNNCDNRCSIQGFSNIDCNTLPKCSQNDNRGSWASSSCGRCGHNSFWPDIYDCPTDGGVISTKTLTNTTLSAINLSECRSISPSSSIKDSFRRNNQTINNNNKNGPILPDRASLCSQSSQSSGASNSSNGSGSHSSGHSYHCDTEYSVPRSHQKAFNDTLYDQPKKIQHKLCNNFNKSKQLTPLCSCHLDQLDVTNKNTLISGNRIFPAPIKINNFCNNLSANRSNDFNLIMSQTIEESGEQHYSVPRTALANIYLKELKASQNVSDNNVIKNIENCCGEPYDVPRKLKSSAQHRRHSNSSFDSNASNSEPSIDTNRKTNNNNNNNNTVLPNNCHQIPAKPINQCMVSLRHNCESKHIHNESELMVTRLGVQRVETINGRITDKQLPTVDVCPNCPQNIGINEFRDKQWITTTDATQQSTHCWQRVNVVKERPNLLTDCQSKANESTSLQNVNYVNMQFVRSIPLYENMEFIANNDNNSKDNIRGLLKVAQNSDQNNTQCLTEVNDKSLSEKSIEAMDDYILMQPIISTEITDSDHKSRQKSMENISDYPLTQHSIETTLNSNKNKSFVRNGIQNGAINEFRRRLSYRQRSNSSDRGSEAKLCISSSNTSSCPPSPALSAKRRLSNRHFFITSKLLYKSKEKSFSIDDIPSAQLSLSNSHCLKFGHKISFHKSADCLKQRADDYRSSDEDLCTSSQITVLCASPFRTGHRSVSRGLSQTVVVGNTSSPHITNGLKPESKDQKNLNNCLNFADSTSSSDMSDYIETLSLSSGTSSGSDATYVRSDDITKNSTSVESKQEYSVKKVIDCVTHPHKGTAHPMDSPSPGYESENSFV